MARDEQKPTAETSGAAQAPITREELLAVVRELTQSSRLDADAIAALQAKAGAEVFEKLTGQFWDVRKFPHVSAFNPQGEKDHPRPTLHGMIFWLGYPLHHDELTAGEIDLLNRLQPGIYHKGQWTVMNLRPGVPGTQELLVCFPCNDPDQRANLPRSMTEMLREMVEGVPALV